MLSRETGVPTLNWSKLVRGIVTPAWAIAHWVSPEQSQPPSPSPPSRYGAPSFDWAAPTADPPFDEGGAEPPAPTVPPETPSAPSVAGPAMPSTRSPRLRWKSRTAWRVIGP